MLAAWCESVLANMKLSCERLVILSIVTSTVLSQTSQEMNHISEAINQRENRYSNCSNSSKCPTWFICNSQNSCQCGDEHNYAVVCNNKSQESAILDCYCATYDRNSGDTHLGLCFYNCQNTNPEKMMDQVYNELPQNPDELLNKSACSHFHRTGILCGDCEEEYSPLVLSYNLSCVKCPDGHKNWWKFILAGFVPLTCFYLFVVILNINVTSSHLHGVVWFSQVLSMPAFVRVIMSALSHGSPHLLIATKTFLVFYSFGNLELFRSVIPDICLNVTTLQALALEYLIALYPFMLIILSYILIELHDRQYAAIARIWKPFHKVLSIFRRSWDIHTSVIDSFATFFLLSYVKVLSVSADLLIPTIIYQLGTNEVQLGLYYFPTVRYFGNEHLPYAIIATVILTLFVCIPTLILTLYAFQFFQKFLSLFPFNWHFLRAFVDSFQGCYKDGTEPGTFDCRWFSVITLLIRVFFFILHGMTLSMMYFVYSLIAFTIFMIAVINIQPFKKIASCYSSTEMVFYILFSLVYTGCIMRDIATTDTSSFNAITMILLFLTAFVPIVYMASLISGWMTSRMRWIRYLFKI